jgi:hypothetical protein
MIVILYYFQVLLTLSISKESGGLPFKTPIIVIYFHPIICNHYSLLPHHHLEVQISSSAVCSWKPVAIHVVTSPLPHCSPPTTLYFRLGVAASPTYDKIHEKNVTLQYLASVQENLCSFPQKGGRGHRGKDKLRADGVRL